MGHPQPQRDFNLTSSPSKPLNSAHYDWVNLREIRRNILNTETLGRRSFFLLPGRVFQWKHLYHQVPSPDSCILDLEVVPRWRVFAQRRRQAPAPAVSDA